MTNSTRPPIRANSTAFGNNLLPDGRKSFSHGGNLADEACVSSTRHLLHNMSNYMLACCSPPSVLTIRPARTINRPTVLRERGRPFRERQTSDPLYSRYYPLGRNLRLYRYCLDKSLPFVSALPPFAAPLLPFIRLPLPFTAIYRLFNHLHQNYPVPLDSDFIYSATFSGLHHSRITAEKARCVTLRGESLPE